MFHFDAKRRMQFAGSSSCYPRKGKWNSATIRLEPWQVFILCVVFGWLCADGTRRFRTAYTEVPRKNAKALALGPDPHSIWMGDDGHAQSGR